MGNSSLVSKIDGLRFKMQIPYDECCNAITEFGDDFVFQLLTNINSSKDKISPVTKFTNRLRHERMDKHNKVYLEDMKREWQERKSDLVASDIIGLTIVEIEKRYAEHKDDGLYERDWRYLINVYPEAESKYPPDILARINEWRAVHDKDLKIGDKVLMVKQKEKQESDLPF